MKELNYTKLFNYIKDNRLDLAESYSDWLKLCAALVPDYEDLFIAICSYAHSYNETASRKLFANMKKHGTHSSIATLLYMVKQSGVSEDTVLSFYEEPEEDTNGNTIKKELPTLTPAPIQQPKNEIQPDYIPHEFCERSLSYHSNFVMFLCSILDTHSLESPTIERLMQNYCLGAAKDKSVIFWQIDAKNNIRAGKIMQYNAGSGHRIKNGNGIDWVHSIMKKRGLLPDTFNMVQCLFGEHLLTRYPDKAVAVTESEKSALIGSAVFPSMIWLAVGGISNFTADRLKPLAGRKVIAFPDTDTNGETFRKWSDIAKGIHFAEITVSDLLEREATPQQKENKIDIADWLIENLRRGSQEAAKRELTACERMLLQFEQRNSAVMYLVDVFNLKPTSYTITVD
jgi:hypothetical protein